LADSQSVQVAEPQTAAFRSRTIPYMSETVLYGSSTGSIIAQARIVALAAPISVRHLNRVESNASSAIDRTIAVVPKRNWWMLVSPFISTQMPRRMALRIVGRRQ